MVAKRITQQDELLTLAYEKSARVVYELLNRIVIAKWQDDTEGERMLLRELADMFASTRAYADLLGRRRILLRAQRLLKFAEAESINPIIPSIPFQEAIDALVSRMPALARSAEEVRAVYSVEHSFALARSTSLRLTERIRDAIVRAMREGKPITEAAGLVREIGDWNYAYADIVYRTNLNTSYHAGQFQIMKRPEVREIVPAFRFGAVIDADVRPNHRAMHGVIASIDSRIFQYLCPPLGYRCRCSLISMDVFELRRLGYDPYHIPEPRIPVGAYPDYPEFGKNPAMEIYGAY